MKIEVGDYVRTKYGEITKIDKYLGKDKAYKNMEHYETDKMVTEFLYKEDVIKSSPSIIDLVQVGDYVNGEKVIDIGERGLYLGYADDNEHYSRIFIDESEIKTIVTKEQFENMEYRV